mmetsp:Transcript_25165/g.58162  ORF Transcript_25165/g.58162 Transcript_25165/m.58162 type:complete len:87 (-) Transcript_25165:63-323(-)
MPASGRVTRSLCQPLPTKFKKAVLVLSCADSLESAGIATEEGDEEKDALLFDEYLLPYFEGKFRCLHRGDSFHVLGPKGSLDFQVV